MVIDGAACVSKYFNPFLGLEMSQIYLCLLNGSMYLLTRIFFMKFAWQQLELNSSTCDFMNLCKPKSLFWKERNLIYFHSICSWHFNSKSQIFPRILNFGIKFKYIWFFKLMQTQKSMIDFKQATLNYFWPYSMQKWANRIW